MSARFLALCCVFSGLLAPGAQADEGLAGLRWRRAALLNHPQPGLTAGRRRPDTTGTIDLQRVQVRLDLAPEGAILPPTGQMTVRLAASPMGAEVAPLLAFFFEPVTVTRGGRRQAFERDPETGELLIQLNPPLGPGEVVDLAMDVELGGYCFEATSCIEEGPFRHLVEYGWYALSGEFPVDDRFALELDLGVPRGWSPVAIGGREEPVEVDGQQRWRWRSERDTVLGALALGPTRPVSVDGRVEVFLPPATADEGRMLGAIASQAVEFYGRLLGPFPFSRLGVAPIADEAGVGLGPQANVLLPVSFWLVPPDALEAALVRQVLSHEIGHQYFFNLVGVADLAEGWMSEGFAEYASTRFSEEVTGRPDHARLNYWEYVLGVDEAADVPLNSEALGVDDTMNRVLVMYDKGSVVLQQLRQRSPRFDAALAAYVQAFSGAITTTREFQRFLEAELGEDLEGFFAQWVRRAGYPRLQVRAVPPRDGDRVMTIEIEQLQNRHGRFAGEVTLRGSGLPGGEEQEVRVAIDALGPQQVPLGQAQRLRLDPDLAIFRQVLPEPAADVNLSGVVDGIDLLDTWAAQGRATPDPAWDDALDTNRDQAIDRGDLRAVIEQFGAGWQGR